jgi:hypothetical protein
MVFLQRWASSSGRLPSSGRSPLPDPDPGSTAEVPGAVSFWDWDWEAVLPWETPLSICRC